MASASRSGPRSSALVPAHEHATRSPPRAGGVYEGRWPRCMGDLRLHAVRAAAGTLSEIAAVKRAAFATKHWSSRCPASAIRRRASCSSPCPGRARRNRTGRIYGRSLRPVLMTAIHAAASRPSIRSRSARASCAMPGITRRCAARRPTTTRRRRSCPFRSSSRNGRTVAHDVVFPSQWPGTRTVGCSPRGRGPNPGRYHPARARPPGGPRLLAPSSQPAKHLHLPATPICWLASSPPPAWRRLVITTLYLMTARSTSPRKRDAWTSPERAPGWPGARSAQSGFVGTSNAPAGRPAR